MNMHNVSSIAVIYRNAGQISMNGGKILLSKAVSPSIRVDVETPSTYQNPSIFENLPIKKLQSRFFSK